MPQVIETPGLSKADADATAENPMIDDIPVEILPQQDGTFTVRATYPDGAVIPQAVQFDAQQPPQNPPAQAPPQRQAADAGGPMTISAKGIALIKHFESCMKAAPGGFQAYLDPVRVLTIGWGHTNDNGRQFDANSI